MEYFNFLPTDIILDILSRVPAELIVECKSVCKTWNNLVSHHPLFSKVHLHHLLNHPAAADSGKLGFIAFTYNKTGSIEIFKYFEYSNDQSDSTTPIQKIRRINLTPPFKRNGFYGSCNGLICFGPYGANKKQSHGPVCIGNPITKEYVMLPKINTDCCDTDEYVFYMSSFGYVSSTNEYKVMGIMWMTKFVEIHIYTLGSGNGWRNLGSFNFKCRPRLEEGSFANGALYWLGTKSGTILTFNLSEEKFYENLSAPPLPSYNNYWSSNKLGVLDGFLYFAVWLDVEGLECYDIWLLRKKNENQNMKEQQDEHQSMVWSKEFRINERNLLAVTKSDYILSYKTFNFNIYDKKTSTSKTLVAFKEHILRVCAHKNTLVSLKELGEEDTKIMHLVEGDRKP